MKHVVARDITQRRFCIHQYLRTDVAARRGCQVLSRRVRRLMMSQMVSSERDAFILLFGCSTSTNMNDSTREHFYSSLYLIFMHRCGYIALIMIAGMERHLGRF